eukprot:CAMPEP_0194499134 /NCGR_PEP_ID=MMETSP0253-20130528/15542_1 /TAXON_ID=2966 /ORGANISM="Noctiluca scintillans" /LENGTH=117 /DNA_ID=CAMNT_0039340859 /DNA_START=74 /DNA_END=427 /DNA_ORIENTATION=+
MPPPLVRCNYEILKQVVHCVYNEVAQNGRCWKEHGGPHGNRAAVRNKILGHVLNWNAHTSPRGQSLLWVNVPHLWNRVVVGVANKFAAERTQRKKIGGLVRGSFGPLPSLGGGIPVA